MVLCDPMAQGLGAPEAAPRAEPLAAARSTRNKFLNFLHRSFHTVMKGAEQLALFALTMVGMGLSFWLFVALLTPAVMPTIAGLGVFIAAIALFSQLHDRASKKSPFTESYI